MEPLKETQFPQPRLSALAEAEELIDRLYIDAETHRTGLARALHDDLNGLMVSAAMDFTSAEQLLSSQNQPIRTHLDRGRRTLESAVDMSRKLIEELHPSMLDNFGLFAALKWELKNASQGCGTILIENYPSIEPLFEAAALIALFRVAQEAIGMIFKRGNVRNASIHIAVERRGITIRFVDDGRPEFIEGLETGVATSMISMKHRIRALEGTVELHRAESGATALTVYMPFSDARLKVAAKSQQN